MAIVVIVDLGIGEALFQSWTDRCDLTKFAALEIKWEDTDFWSSETSFARETLKQLWWGGEKKKDKQHIENNVRVTEAVVRAT